jgi:hypothetical protein
LGISSYFLKSDDIFKALILSAATLFSIHFFLLGAYAGAAVAAINATRTFLSLKGFKSNKILIFFLSVYVCVGILIYDSWVDIFPILSGFVATIGLFKFSGIKLRASFFVSESAWLAYGFIVKSIGGIITSVFSLCANLHIIYRLYKDQKHEQKA